MKIPPALLSIETLTSIIEEFVSREGTEYGLHDISLQEKVDQVLLQIGKGEVEIEFDPESQTCQLSAARQ